MSFSYLDLRAAYDHLAPPEAEIPSPTPVVVMAQLNRLADQVYEPAAWCAWSNNTFDGPQLVIRPTARGGCVIQAIQWSLGGGTGFVGLQAVGDAAVIPSTNVERIDIGGPATTFLAGLRDFEALTGIGINAGQELQWPVYVPPGFLFAIGRSGTGTTAFSGTCVVREIPVAPLGY